MGKKVWYEIYQIIDGDLTLALDKADTEEEAIEIKESLEQILREKLYIDKWVKDEKGERPVSGLRSLREIETMKTIKRKKHMTAEEEVEDIIWS